MEWLFVFVLQVDFVFIYSLRHSDCENGLKLYYYSFKITYLK